MIINNLSMRLLQALATEGASTPSASKPHAVRSIGGIFALDIHAAYWLKPETGVQG